MNRRDGRDKVTGRATYVPNMVLPGMLHCAILRSPLPHATVVSIDASAAERLPGVIAVLTRDDFAPDKGVNPRYGPALKDQTVVAMERVRFVGDPVAAVAAESKEIAQQALDLIVVEYSDLPAVYTAQDSALPDAPLLHADLVIPKSGMGDLMKNTRPMAGTNIVNHFHLRQGDVEVGHREADVVVEGTFRLPNVQHSPMEPHGCIAEWSGGGKVTVWTSTQTPYNVRGQLAELFNLPQSRVRVIVPYLGGGFGGKTYPKVEPLVCALARKARRPVKYVASREEEFLIVTRHSVTIHMKTGAKRDGTLVFREASLMWDTGAYADIAPRLIRNGAYAGTGPYKIPHVKIDSTCYYTNKPPSGAFRGYGVSKVAFCYEQQMDELAHALGLDPLAMRLQNMLHTGDKFVTGETLEQVEFAQCLRRVTDNIGWGKPAPASAPTKARGRGMAVIIKGTVTPSTSAAALKINEDGSVNVLVSSVEMGQGAETIMAQMAADAVGVLVDQVYMTTPDTDHTPFDLTTSSSRSTYMMGNAIRQAGNDAKKQLLEIAAPLLEASPADLEVQGGRIRRKGDPTLGVTVSEAMRSAGGIALGSIMGRGAFASSGGVDSDTGQGRASEFWSSAAAAADVEVDTETGQVHVLKYSSAVHSGTPINLDLCHGQAEGSVIMGLGITLMEELKFQDGQPVNASFLDYHVPSMIDIPDVLDPNMITDASDHGPFGAKGMGETDLPAVAPAIANAIYNACGVRLRHIPFTPDKVLAGLKALREGK